MAVTSNLECVGLGVSSNGALRSLIDEVVGLAVPIGSAYGLEIRRWEDPSGARLVFGLGDQGVVIDLLPSFAGRIGADLSEVRRINEELASAAVMDENGEQVTAMAFELEERRFLPFPPDSVSGEASIIALGVDVTTHADNAAFAASPSSLMGGEQDESGEVPAHYVDRGWSWPPRMASESFISYGVFGEPENAKAYARLFGTVLGSELRTVALTGQTIVRVRVRTVGFEVDLCMPFSDPQLPTPGEVIGGGVFLVGSMPSLNPAGR